MKQYKQAELPKGIAPIVNVFGKEFVNHPCQTCRGSGRRQSIFIRKCEKCEGRGFHAYENISMLFLGTPFKMVDVLQVAKGMYAQMAQNPSKPDCGLCIKRPDQMRDEEYRIRRGFVIEDLLALAKPLRKEIKDVEKINREDVTGAGY